ncbi:hypothetical protein KCU82_g1, partial [Aureobasidium melanogenum]
MYKIDLKSRGQSGKNDHTDENTVKKDYGGSLHVLDDRLTDVGLVDQQEMYEARQGGRDNHRHARLWIEMRRQ